MPYPVLAHFILNYQSCVNSNEMKHANGSISIRSTQMPSNFYLGCPLTPTPKRFTSANLWDGLFKFKDKQQHIWVLKSHRKWLLSSSHSSYTTVAATCHRGRGPILQTQRYWSNMGKKYNPVITKAKTRDRAINEKTARPKPE